jgi:hypothetical protein
VVLVLDYLYALLVHITTYRYLILAAVIVVAIVLKQNVHISNVHMSNVHISIADNSPAPSLGPDPWN